MQIPQCMGSCFSFGHFKNLFVLVQTAIFSQWPPGIQSMLSPISALRQVILRKLGMLVRYNSFLSNGEAGSSFSFLLPTCAALSWRVGTMVSAYMLVQTGAFVCAVTWVQHMLGPISALRQAKQKPVPWAVPRKVGMLAVWSNLFPPQGETGSWTSDHVLCWEWLLWQEDISSFSTNFIVAGFILVQDVVTHNQFLAFSQKKFIHILLNWCVQSDKEESRASYSPILLMSLCLMFYFLGGL